MGDSSVNKPENIEEKLLALRKVYAQQLPGNVDDIESRWRLLNEGEWDWGAMQELHRVTHSVTGSGATFGFSDASDVARNIEKIFKSWLQENTIPDASQKALLPSLFDALRLAASEPSQVTPTQQSWTVVIAETDRIRRLIYLLEDDSQLAEELALQLEHFGYEVQHFVDSSTINTVMSDTHPLAMIVDITLPEGPMAGPGVVQDLLSQHGLELPVIYISSRSDYAARMTAVRAGGDAYMVKPLDIASLIDRLDVLTNRYPVEPYRIMIIDDDEVLAAHYTLVLEQAGMSVAIVNQPKKATAVLAEFSPELILMDIYMPDCSGLELARLIRQQDSYLAIPIVFLSSELNMEKQFLAMSMGADDFLTKPITDEYLVASVRIRAERSRLLNAQMVQDGLTGLLKHTAIKEQLVREVSRATRQKASFCFAMLDIDLFKAVNDTYGHMSGDQVIKSLSRLLKERLRASDIVGRYGGEEFAVILPDTDTEPAVTVLQDILERFKNIIFRHDEQEFSCSFSAGVAAFPLYDNAEMLNRAADEALYEAKRQGRKQVCVAHESGE